MTPATSTASPLLFSVDLEEFYPATPGSDARSTALPELVAHYLELLRRHDARCTFFVVGGVASRYPELLRTIAADGHELGCHGAFHRTLDEFTPEGFAADLRANREAVEAAAGGRVAGFRAPLLSLTGDTAWAHEVLAAEGFTYSSSVLPAPNPLYGWAEFGPAPRRTGGILEIPVTLARLPVAGALPLFCGTYFRVFPWPAVRRQIPRLDPSRPLVCYFHPYDIDHRQPLTMHAGVRGSRVMNRLLFLRRRSLLRRLAALLEACPSTATYREYADTPQHREG
jgi:polysaccharide deacetylase family protein (PEP-CTERM system associated)